MVKKRIYLKDGRYLIYYSFPEGPPPREKDSRGDARPTAQNKDKPSSRGRARV